MHQIQVHFLLFQGFIHSFVMGGATFAMLVSAGRLFNSATANRLLKIREEGKQSIGFRKLLKSLAPPADSRLTSPLPSQDP